MRSKAVKPFTGGSAKRTVSMEGLEERKLFSAGLTGTYFDDDHFGTATTTHVDSAINFTWTHTQGTGKADDFSARWTGQVKAKYSETYTFYTQATGGVRLWVNNSLVINDAGNTNYAQNVAKIPFQFKAGQSYNVVLEFANASKDASKLKLYWSSSHTSKQLIPTTNLASTIKDPQKIRISFRDSASPTPQFYRADNGAAYGNRGYGYTYGWDVDNSSYDFDRNSSTSFSERYDGGALLQPNGQNRTWQIAVPNGKYTVRIVAGDATETNSTLAINVEGVATVRGKTDVYSHWFDGTSRVTVTDGAITVTNAAGAVNDKINFIEIAPLDDAAQIMSWKTIGYSGGDPATRGVSPTDFSNGWQSYIEKNIQSELDQGVTRFMLHNPFGLENGDAMVLEQYLQAKQAGLTWLTDDFVSAWKPITAKGVEVIAYIGNDLHFENASAAVWNQTFWSSIQPFLDAKMSIAIDASVLHTESSQLYQAVQKLRSMDVKVYVESRQNLSQPQWDNFPVISETNWWDYTNPKLNPSVVSWAVPDDQITGEVIRWVQAPTAGYHWNEGGWLIPATQSIIKTGATAALPFDQFVFDGSPDVEYQVALANGYRSDMITLLQ